MTAIVETSRTVIARTRIERSHLRDAQWKKVMHILVDNARTHIVVGFGRTQLEAHNECMRKAAEFVEDLFNEE